VGRRGRRCDRGRRRRPDPRRRGGQRSRLMSMSGSISDRGSEMRRFVVCSTRTTSALAMSYFSWNWSARAEPDLLEPHGEHVLRVLGVGASELRHVLQPGDVAADAHPAGTFASQLRARIGTGRAR
jgi:hypothetical protein